MKMFLAMALMFIAFTVNAIDFNVGAKEVTIEKAMFIDNDMVVNAVSFEAVEFDFTYNKEMVIEPETPYVNSISEAILIIHYNYEETDGIDNPPNELLKNQITNHKLNLKKECEVFKIPITKQLI